MTVGWQELLRLLDRARTADCCQADDTLGQSRGLLFPWAIFPSVLLPVLLLFRLSVFPNFPLVLLSSFPSFFLAPSLLSFVFTPRPPPPLGCPSNAFRTLCLDPWFHLSISYSSQKTPSSLSEMLSRLLARFGPAVCCAENESFPSVSREHPLYATRSVWKFGGYQAITIISKPIRRPMSWRRKLGDPRNASGNNGWCTAQDSRLRQ